MGSELQATVADEDGVDPAKVQYQWLRDGQEISGANGASYTLQAEDAGHKISVKASYTDNGNHAENLTSAETGSVSDGNTPPQNHEGTITVTGEAKVGSELQATVTDEDGVDPAKVQYQWLCDGEVIADAGGSSYRLVADDVGHKISVKASYTDNGNHAEVLTSTGTDAVANLPAPTLERDPQHQGGIIARPADGADYMEVQYRAEYGAKESTIVRKDPTTGEWSASGAYQSLDAKTGEVVIPPNAVEDGTTVRAYNSIGENGKGGHSDTVEVTADNDLSTVGLPEITQDSAHQGGMIIKPGANSDTLEISYTDEKEQAHQLTVYKDQFDNDQWKGKDLPEGVQVDATSGTVTLAPQVVKDRSEVQARSGDSAGNDFSDYVKGISDVNGVMPNQPGSVAISGEAKVGSDLTATVTDADGVPETVQYQWLRDGTPIGGATGNSYTLQAEDAGHKISVRATYRDNAQHDETPTSSETDSVADNVQPNQPGQVAISGSHKVNEPLTATVNDADGVPDNGVQYQWFNAGTGKDIAGATGNNYTPGVADAGQKFGVRVSYQDNKGHEENLTVSDDAVVQSAGKPTVGLIGPNVVNEGGQGNYTLKLDKPTHEDVTVTLEATSYFNGPAPKDIVYNKTVRIPAGETEVTVPLSVKDDHEIKSGSFGLGITGASGADVSTDAKLVTTRVIDNDAADGLPSVNISTDRPMLTAGETATYKVTLSKPANHAVTMDIRVDGSLKVGTGDDSDLKLSTQKITIPAGETEATFTASAKPDSVAAGQTTTFHLAPDNLQGAEMGKDPRWGGPQNNEVNGSINGANSTPQVMLVGDDAVVREGDQVTLKIQLSHATDHDVSVTVRSGSYDGSSFVEGGTQTVTIPKGQTSTSFTLTTKDDQVARAVNHADVFIENANGAEIARYRGHSVSINALDNDAHPAPTATKDGNGMINLTPGFDISQENNQLAYMQVRFTDRSGQTYELRAKLDNHAFSNQWGFADGYGINSFSGVTIDKQTGTVTIPQSLLQPGSEVSAQNHNDPYGSAASATTTTQADTTPTENVPTPPEETKPAEAATAPGGALHHETPVIAHGSEDDTAAHHAGGDSHHGLHVSDGIDTAAYSGLVNLDGEDLLHYLGEHSAELLAASKTASNHALHGGAGDDVLVAGHGAALLEGGAGADTFAYLLDSHDASGWNEPGKILDFNPQEGDRIVLAGGSGTKASVSSDEHGQHLHVSDDAGHTRTIDIASQGGKTLSAEDILSHVDIAPKGYSEPSYTAPQTHHLPQDDHSHLI